MSDEHYCDTGFCEACDDTPATPPAPPDVEAQIRERHELEVDTRYSGGEPCMKIATRYKANEMWLYAAQLADEAHADRHMLLALLAEARRELSSIDAVLSRRPALDHFATRFDKIEHAITTASRADTAEAANVALLAGLRTLFDTYERADSNRGCFSCSERHDSRCEASRGIVRPGSTSAHCTCGRVELDAAEAAARALLAQHEEAT